MSIEFSFNKQLGNFKLDVNRTFQDGITGVFGPSGSGKTTFLNCLAGLIKPDQGSIKIKGKEVFSSTQRLNCPVEKRDVGIVFQDSLLFPHMTVRQNIFYNLKDQKKYKKKVNELSEILNLFKLLHRHPENLSGGEKQRVALARALIRQPSALLMDEPMSSVDIKTRSQILVYLRRVHQALKIPLVYVSHSISEMLFLVNQVMVLDHGKGVSYGAPFETLLNSSVGHLTDSTDIENIFDLPVSEFRVKENLVVLNLDGTPIYVAYYSKQIRPSVRIRIKARDIIVANSFVGGISARNVLEAKLNKIVKYDGEIVLYTSVNNKPFLVEITPPAFNEMNLKEGEIIYLIIKARSIIVLE